MTTPPPPEDSGHDLRAARPIEAAPPAAGDDAGASMHGGGMQMSYQRFGAMIATSTIVMFLFTYLNTYAWDHVNYSETRVYMSLMMGASMAVIMLAFMLAMYRRTALNIAIVGGAVVVFLLALFLVRSQTLVDDSSYMRGMIPHHSIAILTSEHAQIEDARVCDLAVGIIEAQQTEIDEMQWLLADIAENGKATTRAEADQRPVPEFPPEVNLTCPGGAETDG